MSPEIVTSRSLDDKLPWVDKLTAFSFSWTQASIHQILRDNPATQILVDSEQNPKAFILWLNLGDEVELLALAVSPEHQRKGLMQNLWMRWVSMLRNQRFKRVWLEVHANNTPALCLYQKLGFEEVGSRTNYYQDGGKAIVLRRVLDA